MFVVKLGNKKERFGLIWALIPSVSKIKLTNSVSEEIKQLFGPSIIVHEKKSHFKVYALKLNSLKVRKKM